MAVPKNIDSRRYYRAACQRFEDGQLMLEELNRPAGAIYLAGYAVECALKALLLAETPTREQAATLKRFRGAAGHDLLWLRRQLAARKVALPPELDAEMAYVRDWSVDLRYEPSPGDRDDAQRFISATRAILAWVGRRL